MKIININNGPEEEIRWYRKKGENDEPPADTHLERIDENETIGDLPWQKKKET